MCDQFQQLFLGYGFCGLEERLPVVAGACREAGIGSLADFDGVRDIRSVPELAGLMPSELSFLEEMVGVATGGALGVFVPAASTIAAMPKVRTVLLLMRCSCECRGVLEVWWQI